MKTGKPLSLKVKLLLVLLPIVFIYTWILTAVNSSYIMSSTQNSLKKTMEETAQITSEHITNSISNNKNLTTLLANRVASTYENEIKKPYDELDVTSFAQEIAKLGVDYGFLHMMVAGTDGYTKTTLHTNLVEKNADYYTAIMNDKKEIYISDVTLDQGSFQGKYVLNYSAPIKDMNGNIIGVLICKSDAVKLSELVSKISVGKGGSTFIMDNRGQCIAHKNSEMLFSGETYLKYKSNEKYPTINKLWDTMIKEDNGYLSYDFQGKRLAAFCHIKGTNHWSIAVSVFEEEFTKDASNARRSATWIGLAMILFTSALLLFLFRYMTQGIQQVTNRLESLADGNLNNEVTINRSSDETYRLSGAAAKLIRSIQNIILDIQTTLSEISNGNLTVKPGSEYPGDFAEIKLAMETNLVKLNRIIQSISRTSEEVARGSSQMASGASGLAQGASEQASSLEELFETVTTLAQRTYEIGGINRAKLADIENEEADGMDENELAEHKIDAADTLAEKLTIAITKIAEASGSIRRIASNIESISSETGMLALNASVEATHAGEAGRGFSVIASEIRNLSDKSRDAAKDADNKIDSITRAVNRGTQTVDITVSTISEMTMAMNQVKSALEQISNIVENIAATAEETAAGSEELSAQADLLKNLVAEFKYNTSDLND